MEVMTSAGFFNFTNLSSEDIPTDDFKFLGSGVSRRVFALSETLALKVDNLSDSWAHAGSNETEWNTYQDLCDRGAGDLVAKIHAHADDFSWLIVERVEGTAEDLGREDGFYDVRRTLQSEYGIGDLHDGNMGRRHDGSWVAIDYAYIGGGAMMSDSEACDCEDCNMPSECECFNCDCDRCWPEGCGCETFEGCKMTRCEMCEHKGNHVRDIVNDWNRKPVRRQLRATLRTGANGRGTYLPNFATLPTHVIARLARDRFEQGEYAEHYVTHEGTQWKMCDECADEFGHEGSGRHAGYKIGEPNLWGCDNGAMGDMGNGQATWWNGPRDVLVNIREMPWLNLPNYGGVKIVRPLYFARMNNLNIATMVCKIHDPKFGWIIRTYSVSDLLMVAPIFGEF